MKSKRFLFILATLLVLWGFMPEKPQADSKASHSTQVSTKRTVRFELLGLNESRVNKAERALLQLQGVKHVEIDVSRRMVVLTFDIEQTSLKKIKASLRRESLTPVL